MISEAFLPDKKKLIFSAWIGLMFASLLYLAAPEIYSISRKVIQSTVGGVVAFIGSYILYAVGTYIIQKFSDKQ